jgi:hypothetical protein
MHTALDCSHFLVDCRWNNDGCLWAHVHRNDIIWYDVTCGGQRKLQGKCLEPQKTLMLNEPEVFVMGGGGAIWGGGGQEAKSFFLAGA